MGFRYLVNEMIVSGTIEITMEREIAQGLPWRLVGMDVRRMDGLTVGWHGGHIVSHRGCGHHGDAGHRTVTQFSALLQSERIVQYSTYYIHSSFLSRVEKLGTFSFNKMMFSKFQTIFKNSFLSKLELGLTFLNIYYFKVYNDWKNIWQHRHGDVSRESKFQVPLILRDNSWKSIFCTCIGDPNRLLIGRCLI